MEQRTVTLTPAECSAILSVISHALDQAHDDIALTDDEYLQDLYGHDRATFDNAAKKIAPAWGVTPEGF